MTEYRLDIDESEPAIMILPRPDSLKGEQESCDLVICVEGKKIHVNREVLCAASDYFNAMFSHDTKEKQEGVVEMKDVGFSAVKKCVDFIYSGKISVSENECEDLLYCTSLMQLNKVCEEISLFLENCLTPKSFFNIRRIAVKFSLEMLNAVCNEFARHKLFSLARQEEFNDLDIDYISYILASKRSSGWRIADSKLAVMLQWIKADADNRDKYLMKLVKYLDTSELTFGYTRFLVESEPLCIKFPEFMRELFIGKANSHRVEMTRPPNLPDDSPPTPNSLVMFDNSSRLVHLYQPSERRTIRLNAYHRKMYNCFTACILKDCLYVLNENGKVFRLNLSEKNSTWLQLIDMLHDHGSGLECTVYADFIFVGGRSKMERYEFGKSEKWEDIDLDGNICNDSALVAYDDLVFIIGGDKGGPVSNVTNFSPSTSAWKTVKSMNIAREHASTIVFDGKIYVAGGWTGISKWSVEFSHKFEMYDRVSDSWTILPEICYLHSFYHLHLVDNQIFAVGTRFHDWSIDAYDSKNKKWTPHHDYDQKIEICAAATVATYYPMK